MKLIHALPDVIQIRVVLMDVPDITLVADVLVVNLHPQIITSGVVIVNVIMMGVWLMLDILALIIVSI